jgi:putative endonuclease
MYIVYILQSLKDLKTYTGYTENLKVRLQQHNSGKVDATKNRRPLVIIFTEEVGSLLEVKSRELYWKSGVGRRKLKSYFKFGFPPNGIGRGSLK